MFTRHRRRQQRRASHILKRPQIEFLEARHLLATYQVISTGDGPDENPGDGVCSSPGFELSGPCTLRAAIEEANATPDVDLVTFAIPGDPDGGQETRTIQPRQLALPPIQEGLTIDGYSQDGASPNTNGPGLGTNARLLIELDGSLLTTPGAHGLTVNANDARIRGLAIYRFPASGIQVNGNGVRVEGNYVGTDAGGGESSLGNGGSGLQIAGDFNEIGGPDNASRNVVSGNNGPGVELLGSGNVVDGNHIGTDATGAQGLGNLGGGVGAAGSDNDIGDNVISGNGLFGVSVGGSNNAITGNIIGLDATGSTGIANLGDGVRLFAAANEVASNVISANQGSGVQVQANLNEVSSNIIGLDASGSIPLGNTFGGVDLLWASRNTLNENVVSGNSGPGVAITGPFDGVPTLAEENVLTSNLIGTDATGNLAIGNTSYGVLIRGGNDNQIGGLNGLGNAISGNDLGGVFLGAADVNADNNVFQGNRIGTDNSGTNPLGNGGHGVHISSGTRNLIGGSELTAGNIVSANALSGILIGGELSSEEAPGVAVENLVLGNLVGTDIAGAALLGNASHGVSVTATAPSTASRNRIGGTTAGEGNLIAGNGGAGVLVSGLISVDNSIRGNSIQDNIGLAIDLGVAGADGRTGNDVLDPDIGGNNLQNVPVLLEAIRATGTRLVGRLDSLSNSSFVIDFYAADSDTAGAQTYLGSSDPLQTDNVGSASFDVTLPVVTEPGDFILATATEQGDGASDGSTSEFSDAIDIFTAVEVRGRKFNDRDANGLKDAAEPGLSGWTIELLVESFDGERVSSETRITDGEGNFSFTSIGPGNVTVREMVRSDWTQTAPANPTGTYTFATDSGQDVTGLEFGNYLSFATGAVVGSANLDGQGLIELIAVNDYSDTVSLASSLELFGARPVNDIDSNGVFGDRRTLQLPMDARPQSVFVGDLDGDGDEDLAVASVGSSTSPSGATDGILLFSRGDSSFDSAGYISTCASGTVEAVRCESGPVDVDGGGFLNSEANQVDFLVTANFRDNSISIVRRDAIDGFACVDHVQTLQVGSEPIAVTVGRIDNDAFTDIAVANHGSGSVFVYAGNGRGDFTLSNVLLELEAPSDILLEDLNGDSLTDLTVANSGSDSVTVFLNQGDGSFDSGSDFPVGMGPQSIAVGDLNDDQTLDLAVANAGSGDVSVLLGNSSGPLFIDQVRFGLPPISTTNAAAGQSPQVVLIDNLDDQGRPDLVVAHLFGGVSVHLNGIDTPGVVSPPLPVNTLSTNPADLFARADTNRDGSVSPVDVLLIIDYLNGNGEGTEDDYSALDVNGDGVISPRDALQVVRELNSNNTLSN